MEGQIQAVPIVIDEEDPSEAQSIICGSFKYPDSSTTLFQNLSVGTLQPEPHLGARIGKLNSQSDIFPRLLQTNGKDSTLERSGSATKISKMGESPFERSEKLQSVSSILAQPKVSVGTNGSQSVPSSSFQGANNLFKNKPAVDRAEKNPQKNSNKDSSFKKNNELIIIDDEAESEGVIDTTPSEDYGKPRVGFLNKEANNKAQSAKQDKDDVVVLELPDESSESKNSGKKGGNKKMGYLHKIQNLQNLPGAEKIQAAEEPFNPFSASSKIPKDLKAGLPLGSLPYASNPLLDLMSLTGSALPNPLLGAPAGIHPMWQTLLAARQGGVYPHPQDLMYGQPLISYLQQLKTAQASNRLVTPFSFLNPLELGQFMSFAEREKTKNSENPPSEEIIQINDDIPETLEPKVVDIKEGEIAKMMDKGGGKKLFMDDKSAQSILEKAFNPRILAKREKKLQKSKSGTQNNTIDLTSKSDEATQVQQTNQIKQANQMNEINEVKQKLQIERKTQSTRSTKTLEKPKASKSNEEVSPLQENLEKPKRRTTRAIRPQAPAVPYSTTTESPMKRERRKNKMQLLAEERENLENHFKQLEEMRAASDNSDEAEDEEEEEEYASLMNYPNPKKKIKKTKVGPNFQAMVPPLELSKEKAIASRRFKCVWDPVAIGEDKIQEFFRAVKDILKLNTYHEDFLIRLLAKNQNDLEKTLSIVKTNEDYFVNLFKQKRAYVPLKKVPQQPPSDLM